MRIAARRDRRILLAGFGGIAATLGGLAVGIPLLFPDAQPPARFSNYRVVPPLLRARLELRQPYGREADRRGTPPGDLPAEEALFALVRADMRFLGAPEDGPPPFEMLQLWPYIADDIWSAGWRPIAVVEPGGAPDARLIAAQGDTVWVWADQLVAAGPGWMGRTTDQAELQRLNPELGLDRPGLRDRLGLAEALVLDASPTGRGWAFDPATRIARPRDEPRTAPWPPLRPAVAPEGPVTAPEGRLGELWFGLLPERMTIPGTVRAQDAGGGFLPRVAEPGPLRLWRGRVRAAAGDPARPGATDLLEAAEPVPDVAPIPFGGLLMAGPGQLFTLPDPASILLAQLDPTGAREERLRRFRPDGAPVWDIALPTSETIAWVSAEPGRLWLLATPRRSFAALHAIALADGRIIRTRHI